MKRYTILPLIPEAEGITVPFIPRIKIEEADNGEWVRYEDVKRLKAVLEAAKKVPYIQGIPGLVELEEAVAASE